MNVPLAADGLGFGYDGENEAALVDVDLSVPAGLITAVVGASGSGKTTLARVLAGVDLPGQRSGRVRRPSRVGLIGSSPHLQRSGVAPDVATEIAFGLQYAGLTRAEQHHRVGQVSSALGLGALLDRSPDQLSGGEQQRVALASVLALRPAAVVLDDAAALLDPAGGAQLGRLLVEVAGSGTAVLTLGGRPEDTVAHAATTSLLVGGRVAATGSAAFVLGGTAARRAGVRQPAITRLSIDLGLPAPWPTTDDELSARHRPAPSGAARPAVRRTVPTVELPPATEPPPLTLDAVSAGLALRGVDLELAPGTALGIAGPNGAGKTTLVRLLNGLRRPSAGTVRHAGRDVARTAIPELSRTVGIVFADPDQQLVARTVRAEVAFGPRAYRLADVADRVEACLHAVGLSGVADRHPYELSFPERKLLGLAATLAAGPSVVVLDEPTATLDRWLTDRVESVLATLRAEGRTVVLVSHDVELLATHTDRLLVLRDGLVHRDGPSEIVLADPGNLIGRPAAFRHCAHHGPHQAG
ncbi:MAG: ABC transporter ATP-binding protein [Propionibacteriaceae bacterium]